MAYDLLLRKQTPSSFARGDSRSAGVAGAVGLAISAGYLALQRISRWSEKRHYRREFAAGLDRTQEMPSISMQELVEQPREKW